MWNKTKASLVLSLLLLCFFSGVLSDCDEKCNQRCNSKIDIVFVLDEDCEHSEYEQLKAFGYSFAEHFEIGPDAALLGAVGYSENSRVLFPLAKDQTSVQRGFSDWVQSNDHESNVQAGIHGGSDCFKPYPQRNPDLEVIIIITKHNPNKCDDGSDAAEAALQEANSCRSHPNRKIITIVIGEDCDVDYYRRLSSPDSVFVVPSYCALNGLIIKLVDFLCYRPPTLWIPPDYNASCCGNCTLPPESGQAKAFGYCHGCPPELSYTDKPIEKYSDDTFYRYIRRTWTATDKCGNSKSGVQKIFLLDHEPPTLYVPEDKTFECCNNIYKYDFGNATASDNCDEDLQITYHDSFFGDECPSILQRVFSVYDSCGNQASGIQTITFIDTTPPFIIRAHDFCITPDNHKKFCIYNLTKSDLIVAEDYCSDVEIEFIGVTSTCSLGIPTKTPYITYNPTKTPYQTHYLPTPTRTPYDPPTSTPTPTPTPYDPPTPTPTPYDPPTYYPTRTPYATYDPPSRTPTYYPTRTPYSTYDPPSRTPTYTRTPPSTRTPTYYPTRTPTYDPTRTPTYYPTRTPTYDPTRTPTYYPTRTPTYDPTRTPTYYPTRTPTYDPTRTPTYYPTRTPTYDPTRTPTYYPTRTPTYDPTRTPSPNYSKTPDPTKTLSVTRTPLPSYSKTPDPTKTLGVTRTPLLTYSPTYSKTPDPTRTPSPAYSKTPDTTRTPPPIYSKTPDPTNTPITTRTPSPAYSKTPDPTNTPVATRTPLPTYAKTPDPTTTPIATRTPSPTNSKTPNPTNTLTNVPNVPLRIRDLKSFGEDDEPLRDVGYEDGKCEYDQETDTLCIDSKPCHYGDYRADRIHHIKFAVTDECGNTAYKVVTVTVPAYSNDPRCKDCVYPG